MSNYNELCDRIKEHFHCSCGFFTAEHGFHRVASENERRKLDSYPDRWPPERVLACYLNGWSGYEASLLNPSDSIVRGWKLMDENSTDEEMVKHGKELCDKIFDFLVQEERKIEEKRARERERKRFRKATKGTPDEVVSVRLSVREIKLAAEKLAKVSPETSSKLLAAIPRREDGIHGKN